MGDPTDLELLHHLQTIDSSLDQAAYRRVHLDERTAHQAAHAATAAARKSLGANAARRQTIDAEYGAIEQSGRQLDAKIARLEGQMRNVVVTREAEAIQREIATLRSERDAGDEQGLVLLDESESLAALVPALEAEIAALEAAERVVAAALAAAEADLDESVAVLRSERETVVASLPGDLAARYEQMRPSFKGVAVARLHGTRCTGCHLDLSRVEIEALRAVPPGEVPECPQCARILVPEARS